MYSDGKFTTISAPGAQFTTLQGINDFGQIVGFDVAATGGRIQSFLYEHGVFKTFAVPGADSNSTIAYGINNRGQIVGDYQVNGVGHGFIDTHGKFQTIDAPGADIHSGTLVRGINDFGQIVGQVGSHGFFGQPSFG